MHLTFVLHVLMISCLMSFDASSKYSSDASHVGGTCVLESTPKLIKDFFIGIDIIVNQLKMNDWKNYGMYDVIFQNSLQNLLEV